MSILVVTTGGTIGALPYDDFSHTAEKEFIARMPTDGKDLVKEVLQKNFGFQGRCISLEVRDSKLVDEAYRGNILSSIQDAPEDKILVTHGTDSLLQTADFFYRVLKTNLAMSNKVIFLTGSMMPLSNGPESDGYTNLNFALRQLEDFKVTDKGCVCIVLCDYESPETETGSWVPHLYKYVPNTYEKVYTEDGRYNRLRKILS